MTRLPVDLLLACVDEMEYRSTTGAGSWRAGVPQCFIDARKFLNLELHSNWVLVVTTIVESQCVHIVSQLKKSDISSLGINPE